MKKGPLSADSNVPGISRPGKKWHRRKSMEGFARDLDPLHRSREYGKELAKLSET